MNPRYRPVSVFGVPTDIGAARRGASMGPEALRVAGFVEALAARGVDVEDLGDVPGPRNPTSAPVDGYRHLDEVVAWNRAVYEASERVLAAGRMPILLGGGAGSEVMQRIAAPMVGGMLSAPLLSMLVIPAAYALLKHRRLLRGPLQS